MLNNGCVHERMMKEEIGRARHQIVGKLESQNKAVVLTLIIAVGPNFLSPNPHPST